uniref:Uncharacterized protein n=1 Tax=Arundo donax TaxID=35708 RepID=A0A0A9SZF4_ARUDO
MGKISYCQISACLSLICVPATLFSISRTDLANTLLTSFFFRDFFYFPHGLIYVKPIFHYCFIVYSRTHMRPEESHHLYAMPWFSESVTHKLFCFPACCPSIISASMMFS